MEIHPSTASLLPFTRITRLSYLSLDSVGVSRVVRELHGVDSVQFEAQELERKCGRLVPDVARHDMALNGQDSVLKVGHFHSAAERKESLLLEALKGFDRALSGLAEALLALIAGLDKVRKKSP